MNKAPYSIRRLVGTVFLSWFAVVGFDFLLHGGVLADLYSEPSPFLLSPEESFRLIPLGYLGFLIFQIFLVWLLVRLRLGGWREGLLFGLKVGAFTWGALSLGLLSISTASPWLLVSWFIGQTIEAGIAGLVAGEGLITRRPLRLTLTVFAFVMLAVVFTIVLQSMGLTPQF